MPSCIELTHLISATADDLAEAEKMPVAATSTIRLLMNGLALKENEHPAGRGSPHHRADDQEDADLDQVDGRASGYGS